MARFAHPFHCLSDAEQARVRCLVMEWLLLFADDAEWRQEHTRLLRLKTAAATPRNPDEPVRLCWRPEDGHARPEDER